MTKYNLSYKDENEKKSISIKNNLKYSLDFTDFPENPDSKFGYVPLLNNYRNDINNIKAEDWKRVRWYINDCDFLVKDPLINRAFYKYWEIINEFEIFENYKEDDIILHCAEAPGGFIQGSNIYLQIDRIVEKKEEIIPKKTIDEHGFITINKKQKKQKNNYRIYTISLNKDLPQYKNYNLPTYNKSVLNKHVHITYGKDNTGDINNWDNIKHIKHISKIPFYLITADGGFDEGTDFNNKEQLHYLLILSEIYAAIKLQKNGGHYILKVFDVFTETSVHLLYLLSQCWEGICVYKPKTSRPTNSEKYIICKNFCVSEENKMHILNILENLSNNIKRFNYKYISFRLFKSIPEDFILLIQKMNKLFLNKQCEFLQKAVDLCKDPVFLKNYNQILTESIENKKLIFYKWEEQYNLNCFV